MEMRNARFLLIRRSSAGVVSLYSPTSDQILLQLSVTTSSETVSETVTVILPKTGEARTYPQPVRPAGPALPTPPPPESIPLVKAEKPFVTSSVGKGAASSSSPALQEPPVQGLISAAPIALPGVLPSIAPATSPVEPASSPASLAPTSQQLAPNTVKYQPPVPVFKVAPSFSPPELAKNLTVNNTMVEVNVNIDAAGKVTKAVAVPQKNVSGFLLSAATKAAQLWRFQPAKRGGEPVSSELTVQFYFGH